MEDVAGLNNLDKGVGGNGNEEENGNPMEYFDGLDNLDEGFNGLDGDGDMNWGTGQVEYEEPVSFYHEQYETEMGCEKEAEVFDEYEEESDSDDPSYDKAPYEASDDDTESFSSFVVASDEEELEMPRVVEAEEQIGEGQMVHSS